MANAERKIPAPEANPETRPFWEAAAAGRLLIGKCPACGKPHYYPRAICPFCGSAPTEWVAAAGRGIVYSYSVMRRLPVPYALAYVTLDEGVTMMTNIVDCDLDAIRIGQRVRLVFKPSEGGPPVPMFTPELE
jgi:uncharacterized OB-fold protein